jgi:hypothetical protein
MTLKFMTFHFFIFLNHMSMNFSSRVFGDEFWRPLSFRLKLSQAGQACCEMPRGSFRSRTGRRCASSLISCMLHVGGISSLPRSQGAVTAFFLWGADGSLLLFAVLLVKILSGGFAPRSFAAHRRNLKAAFQCL